MKSYILIFMKFFHYCELCGAILFKIGYVPLCPECFKREYPELCPVSLCLESFKRYYPELDLTSSE
jgi:hypothetical protein